MEKAVEKVSRRYLSLIKKYYFVEHSLEPQEIVKISEEPMVSSPLN